MRANTRLDGQDPGGAGPRPEDPQRPRRDRADHLDGDLRLRPAPLQRLHPDDGEGRHPRPRVHGRGGRGRPGGEEPQGRRPRGRAVPDRLRQLLRTASRQLYSLCENSNPNAWMAEKLMGPLARGHLRLLAHARRLRRRPGRVRARAVRRRRPAQGPRRPDRRAGAVPLRHLPDRLHGRRDVRHQAGRRDRRLGLRPGRASSRSPAPTCSAPSGSSPSTASRTGCGWRASGPGPRRSTTRRQDVYEALKEMTGGRGPDACIDAVGMEAHGHGLIVRLRPGQAGA